MVSPHTHLMEAPKNAWPTPYLPDPGHRCSWGHGLGWGRAPQSSRPCWGPPQAWVAMAGPSAGHILLSLMEPELWTFTPTEDPAGLSLLPAQADHGLTFIRPEKAFAFFLNIFPVISQHPSPIPRPSSSNPAREGSQHEARPRSDRPGAPAPEPPSAPPSAQSCALGPGLSPSSP